MLNPFRPVSLILCFAAMQLACFVMEDRAEALQTETVSGSELQQLVEHAKALESRTEFSAAATVWQQIETGLSRAYAPDSWQVTNARLAKQTAMQQSQFDEHQNKMLVQIRQLQEQSMQAANQGDLATSLDQLLNAETLTTNLFGEQSHLVVPIKTRIAGLYQGLGQIREAWQTYRDALTIARTAPGKLHPDTEILYYRLGVLLQSNGDSDRAIDHLKQAVNICETVYGPVHPIYADRLTTLGVAFQATGQYQRALEYLLAGEKIQAKTLGEDHQRRAQTLKDIGVTYLSMREAQQAHQFLQQASQILEARLGPQDAFTLKCRSQLAMALAMDGKDLDAEAVLQDALAGFQETWGPDAPQTATIQFQLGVLKGKRRDFAGAEPLLRTALETQTNQLGREHRSTQRTAAAFAQLLQRTGRDDDAKRLAQSYSGSATTQNPDPIRR